MATTTTRRRKARGPITVPDEFFSRRFSAIVRQKRLDIRLTQDQLAERVEVSSAAIGHYETGFSRPSFEVLVRLSQVLGINAATLAPGLRRASWPDDITNEERPVLDMIREIPKRHHTLLHDIMRAMAKADSTPPTASG